jgi:hypothetical protein
MHRDAPMRRSRGTAGQLFALASLAIRSAVRSSAPSNGPGQYRISG